MATRTAWCFDVHEDTGCEGTVTFDGDKYEWEYNCDTCDKHHSGGSL